MDVCLRLGHAQEEVARAYLPSGPSLNAVVDFPCAHTTHCHHRLSISDDPCLYTRSRLPHSPRISSPDPAPQHHTCFERATLYTNSPSSNPRTPKTLPSTPLHHMHRPCTPDCPCQQLTPAPPLCPQPAPQRQLAPLNPCQVGSTQNLSDTEPRAQTNLRPAGPRCDPAVCGIEGVV